MKKGDLIIISQMKDDFDKPIKESAIFIITGFERSDDNMDMVLVKCIFHPLYPFRQCMTLLEKKYLRERLNRKNRDNMSLWALIEVKE